MAIFGHTLPVAQRTAATPAIPFTSTGTKNSQKYIAPESVLGSPFTSGVMILIPNFINPIVLMSGIPTKMAAYELSAVMSGGDPGPIPVPQWDPFVFSQPIDTTLFADESIIQGAYTTLCHGTIRVSLEPCLNARILILAALTGFTSSFAYSADQQALVKMIPDGPNNQAKEFTITNGSNAQEDIADWAQSKTHFLSEVKTFPQKEINVYPFVIKDATELPISFNVIKNLDAGNRPELMLSDSSVPQLTKLYRTKY